MLWMVSLIFALISVLAVYSSISSLAYKYTDGNTLYFLFKHGIMLITGFGIMYAAHKLHFKYYSRISQLAIWLAAVLLLLTLLLGTNLNDASRWLTIPVINQNFQTSDFAKIALVAYVARLLSLRKDKLHSFKEGVLPILLPIALVCGLILPANFSTAAILFATCFIILFVGGVPIKHLFIVVAAAVAGFALLLSLSTVAPELLPRVETWKSRIVSFNTGDSQSNYQTEHAMMAIQAGGIIPKGPGSGDSRNYLPHPYSDMIYAFIIEEYGSFVGGIGVLLLYLIFLFRGIKIATRTDNNFGALLVIGLSFLLSFQAFINMGVAVNLLPVTGQPLPLISMGGTSIWFTCIAIGIILSVSRTVYDEEKSENKNKIKKKDYALA